MPYSLVNRNNTILTTHIIERHDIIMVSAPPHKGGGREWVFTWYDKLAYTIAAIALLYLLILIRAPVLTLLRIIL